MRQYKNWKHFHQGNFRGIKEKNINWCWVSHEPWYHLFRWTYNRVRLNHSFASHFALEKVSSRGSNSNFNNPSAFIRIVLLIRSPYAFVWWALYFPWPFRKSQRPFQLVGLWMPQTHECLGILLGYDERAGRKRRWIRLGLWKGKKISWGKDS